MNYKLSHKNAVKLGIASEDGTALEHFATVEQVAELADDSLQSEYWSIDDDGNAEWYE